VLPRIRRSRSIVKLQRPLGHARRLMMFTKIIRPSDHAAALKRSATRNSCALVRAPERKFELKMNILLIGATGQISYALAAALPQTDHQTTLLVRSRRRLIFPANVRVVVDSSFPVVHADSLAAAIVRSLDHTGAYIVSDQMTSLRKLALTLRRYARSYVPPTVPLGMAYVSTAVLEFFARLVKRQPILARAQVEFLTSGMAPSSERAQEQLGWQPMPLSQGIQQYLNDRKRLLEMVGA
jgi:nucleoside-diphosphate-sugar epimerase